MKLTIKRRPGESFEITGPAIVRYNRHDGHQVSLTIEAAPSVRILRSELTRHRPEEVRGDVDDLEDEG